MALTILPKPIRATMDSTNTSPFSLQFGEAASQTFKLGDPVFGSANQIAVIASATPAKILGVAHSDATGTTNNMISVWIANNTTIFEANLMGAAAATTDYTSLAADMLAQHDIGYDTNNLCWVIVGGAAATAASTPRVFVWKPAGNAVVGDLNPRVLFSWIPKYVQNLITS